MKRKGGEIVETAETVKTVKGTVKWFSNKRGYGFITMENGKDIFVHYTAIKSNKKYKMLGEGQKVEFNIEQGRQGEQAGNVVAKTPLPPMKENEEREDRS